MILSGGKKRVQYTLINIIAKFPNVFYYLNCLCDCEYSLFVMCSHSFMQGKKKAWRGDEAIGVHLLNHELFLCTVR